MSEPVPSTKNIIGAKPDEQELKLLDLIYRQGSYTSCIVLAADFFGTTDEVQEWRVFEWTLVALLLEDLNAKGYVTYRLATNAARNLPRASGERYGPANEPDIPVHIRLTRAAYPALGLKWDYIRITGDYRHSTREQPIHGWHDRTDYRTHSDTAEGGPTVREDLIDHCVECDHRWRHARQLRELFGTDDV